MGRLFQAFAQADASTRARFGVRVWGWPSAPFLRNDGRHGPGGERSRARLDVHHEAAGGRGRFTGNTG